MSWIWLFIIVISAAALAGICYLVYRLVRAARSASGPAWLGIVRPADLTYPESLAVDEIEARVPMVITRFGLAPYRNPRLAVIRSADQLIDLPGLGTLAWADVPGRLVKSVSPAVAGEGYSGLWWPPAGTMFVSQIGFRAEFFTRLLAEELSHALTGAGDGAAIKDQVAQFLRGGAA